MKKSNKKRQSKTKKKLCKTRIRMKNCLIKKNLRRLRLWLKKKKKPKKNKKILSLRIT